MTTHPRGNPEFPRVEYYRVLRCLFDLFDLKLGAQLTRNT